MAVVAPDSWLSTRLGGRLLSGPLLSGSLWTIAGTAAARGSSLIAAIIVARILGAQTYGEYGALESSVVTFALLANLGLSLTSAKFVARFRRSDSERAGRVLGLCLAVCVVSALAMMATGWILAGWVSSAALGAPHLADEVRIATAILLFSSINGAMNGALVGFQAFRRIAWANLLAGLATIPVLALAASAAGLAGAVAGLLVVQAWTTIVLAVALASEAKANGVAISLRGCWRERGLLTSFSLPALLNTTLMSPVNWLCMALLINREGGFAELGLLHAANPWFLLLMFIPGQLANVYYPMFEDALARNDQSELARVMRTAMQLNAGVCGALTVGLVLAATSILSFYGPEYRDGAGVMRLAVVTGLVVALQQPLHVYLVTVANMWLVAACSAVWAAVFVASSWALLPYGALGIAGARLLAYVVFALTVGWVAWRHWRPAASRELPTRAEENLAA